MALQQRRGEQVQVLTVFAGDPVNGLSEFAHALHRRWALGWNAPAARCQEDRAALQVLGATATHWDLPECIYRRAADGAPLYPDEASLWGPVHPHDEPLLERLAGMLAALPETPLLCAPLGAGDHVDHRMVRQAAEAAGRELLYYEEFPYAGEPGAVAQALGQERWRPRITLLDELALADRVAAVACYRSQISTFWGGVEDMERRVRAYARRVGQGRAAERCWQRVSGPASPANGGG